MSTITQPALISYPPAAINGGPLDTAPAKVGAWVWQPKIDDRRVAIHAPTSTVWNQYGELSVATRDKEKFAAALRYLEVASAADNRFEWLDCGLMEYRHDMMRGCIVIFDSMRFHDTHRQRREALESRFYVLPNATRLVGTDAAMRGVYLINEWRERDPLYLWKMLQEINTQLGRKFYEGLVAKRETTSYLRCFRPKQTTASWVKHRFDQ